MRDDIMLLVYHSIGRLEGSTVLGIVIDNFVQHNSICNSKLKDKMIVNHYTGRTYKHLIDVRHEK